MRLPRLLMGSLLLVPLACGGDDGGNVDTGADTGSGTGTPSTMSMTAADDDDGSMTTSGADDDGGSTGEPPGGSSGEPPADGSSSGEPPADSSGDGGSSSGGAASECDTFCTAYFAVCGESDENDYGDIAGCVTSCEGLEEADFGCKNDHMMMADGPESVHCLHANSGDNCPG